MTLGAHSRLNPRPADGTMQCGIRMGHTFTVVVFGIVAMTALVGRAQPLRGLLFGVNLAEYFGTVYSRPESNRAPWVFYDGERLILNVIVANRSAEGLPVVLDRAPESFEARWTDSPVAMAPFRLAVSSPVVVSAAGTESRPPFGPEIDVPPGGTVTWAPKPLAVPSVSGYYVLQVVPGMRGATAKLLENNPSLWFEVRHAEDSSDDRVEFARRRLVEVQQADAPASEVEAALQNLLRLHPNSAMAYLVKAERARSRGRKREARAAQARAIRLIRSGDTLLAKYMSPERRAEMAKAIETGVIME